MASLISHISQLQQHSALHLLLHTQAVLRRPGDFEIRVYGTQAKNGRYGTSSARGIAEIAVLISHGLQERHDSRLAENDVSFRLVIENSGSLRESLSYRQRVRTPNQFEERKDLTMSTIPAVQLPALL